MGIKKITVILCLLAFAMFYISACQNNVQTTLEESFEPYLELEAIDEASNTTITINRGEDQKLDSYFAFDVSNIKDNTFLQEGLTEGWCLEWNKPIAQNNDVHNDVEMFSTFGSSTWKAPNYLMNIRNDIQEQDPHITYREIQVALWSLIKTPEFDLDKVLENGNIPTRLMRNGEPNFSVSKVKQIVRRVRNEVGEFEYTLGTKHIVFANTGNDNQNGGIINDPGSDIQCNCSNPVTQSDGTIAIQNGETRCLNNDFTGSAFFESGGTLNVCSTAELQNIFGNAAGQINISETGDVTVSNWNNNYSDDAISNWGSLTFSNWTTVNNGSLTNHGKLNVSGGINQNNGPVVNYGQMDVSQSVTLNKEGNVNEGTWTIGSGLTLNSDSKLSNSCNLEVSGQFMINGEYSTEAETFTSTSNQLTVNSGGTINMTGNNLMISAGSVMLNGSVTNNGSMNLLDVDNNFISNSGAAITSAGDPLGVCSTNLGALPNIFQITDGCDFEIPSSGCNPAGYN